MSTGTARYDAGVYSNQTRTTRCTSFHSTLLIDCPRRNLRRLFCRFTTLRSRLLDMLVLSFVFIVPRRHRWTPTRFGMLDKQPGHCPIHRILVTGIWRTTKFVGATNCSPRRKLLVGACSPAPHKTKKNGLSDWSLRVQADCFPSKKDLCDA